MQNCLLEVLLTPYGLLTALVCLYINAGKPTKQVTSYWSTVSRNNTKPDAVRREYPAAAPLQAQRGTPKSSSSFLAAVNYCPVDHFIVILTVQLWHNNSCVEI